MMPEVNDTCLPCEDEARGGAVLSPEDIRWIVAYRGPEDFVRAAWRLASESTSAATGLDTRTGRVTVHRWAVGEELAPEKTDGVIILAVCPVTRKAELPGLLAAEGALSEGDAEEIAPEVAVRAALADEGHRFWEGVESQFQRTPGLQGHG